MGGQWNWDLGFSKRDPREEASPSAIRGYGEKMSMHQEAGLTGQNLTMWTPDLSFQPPNLLQTNFSCLQGTQFMAIR